MVHTVKCPTCNGSGRKNLGPHFSHILEIVGRRKIASSLQIANDLRDEGVLPETHSTTLVPKWIDRLCQRNLIRKVKRVDPKSAGSDAYQKVWLYSLKKSV